MAELNVGIDKDGHIVIGRLMESDAIMPLIIFPTTERAREFAENLLEFIVEKEFPVPGVYLNAFGEVKEDES